MRGGGYCNLNPNDCSITRSASACRQGVDVFYFQPKLKRLKVPPTAAIYLFTTILDF